MTTLNTPFTPASADSFSSKTTAVKSAVRPSPELATPPVVTPEVAQARANKVMESPLMRLFSGLGEKPTLHAYKRPTLY